MSATTTIILNLVMIAAAIGGLAVAMWAPFAIARSEARSQVKRAAAPRLANLPAFEPSQRAA